MSGNVSSFKSVRKWGWLAISLTLLSQLVLSACGDSTATTAAPASTTAAAVATTAAPASTTAAAGTATTAAAAIATTAAVASGPVTTISWWCWNCGPSVPGVTDQNAPSRAVVEFNKTHPNIKVDMKFFQYTDYVSALKLAMASGTGPDVINLQAGSLVKEYGEFTEDLAPYATKTWGANWKDRYYPLGFQATQLAGSNKVTSLPFFVSAAGQLWYNKSIFDKNGLTPPKTLDEWVKVSQALQAKGITPFVQGAKDTWVDYDTYIAIANNIAPGKIWDAEAGKIAWTDPDLIKAMDIWGQLFKNGIMQKGALGVAQYPDASDLFTQGKAGMIMMGMWQDSIMTKTSMADAQKKYGFTDTFEMLPVPFPDVTNSGKVNKLYGNADVLLAVNKDGKNKAAAWEFLSWAGGTDMQKLVAASLSIPAIKGIEIPSDDIITDAQKANMKQQLVDIQNVTYKREFLYPDIKTAMGDALQNVASGQQNSQQALEAVEKISKIAQR